MRTATLERLIWVLIYGGLLVVCLGMFVKRSDPGTGWTLIGSGSSLALSGAALVWGRSRRP